MTFDISFANQTQDEIFQKLTIVSLANLPDELRNDIRVVAIPRFFNAEILGVMLSIPIEQATVRYKNLQGLNFVQPYGQKGHTVFDFVRVIILREWKKTPSHTKYIKLNKRLVDFYQENRNANPFHSSAEQAEAIYHEIAVDEQEGFSWFEREFLRSLEFSLYDNCSFLIRTISERQESINLTNRLWIEFYSGQLAERQEKWKEAEEIFKHLEIQEGLPTELRIFIVNRLSFVSQKSLGIIHSTSQDKNNSSIDIDSEISLLEGFYRQKQSESKVSFIFAIIAGTIGFLTIISGVIGAIFANIQLAIVTSAAGIVAEITASLLFVQNNKARDRMDECQRDLIKMRNLSRALTIASTSIVTPTEKEKRISSIVDELIGLKAG